MFGQGKPGAGAYAKVGVETSVLAASPHQLIVLLFDGAIAAIKKARLSLIAGDVQAKGAAVTHAVNIINDGLRASLDKESGGEIALNLDALYSYIVQQIMLGHNRNDVGLLDESARLLMDLSESWKMIAKPPQQVAAPRAIAERA
jgi:flagellar protein FliS